MQNCDSGRGGDAFGPFSFWRSGLMNKADRGGKNRRVQVRRRAALEWTPERRAVFLDHLSATCNVATSAAAAGMWAGTCYALRRRDPAFAEQWSAALQAGYEHLEAKLLARALGDDHYVPADPDTVVPEFDADAALKLLAQRNRLAARGGGGGGAIHGPRYVRVPIEEVEAAILHKLDMMAKQLETAT
jgi:hypothetical protein